MEGFLSEFGFVLLVIYLLIGFILGFLARVDSFGALLFTVVVGPILYAGILIQSFFKNNK